MTWQSLGLAALVAVTPAAALAQESLTDRYREPAGRILGVALTDAEGWEKLEHLTTEIGHRLSGSAGLERAIEWAYERMKSEELTVRKLPVKVPHWVRGEESARVVRYSSFLSRRPSFRTLAMAVRLDGDGLEHFQPSGPRGAFSMTQNVRKCPYVISHL